jgi:thioesterase domain-containing protein
VDRRALPAPGRRAGDGVLEEPVGEAERAIAAVWADVLGCERVGRRGDFFALGGHSLLAVRAVGLLRERLGRRLAVSDLFEHRTVAELARALDAPGGGSPLVPLRRARSGHPVFFVHPSGGHVACYLDLAGRMEGLGPVFGLRAPGLEEGDGAPLADLAELAGRHADEVRRRQPDGPYLLVGWSFGGLVAAGMAERLGRAGKTAALVLLDSQPGGAAAGGASLSPAPGDGALLAQFVADFALQAPSPPGPAAAARLAGLLSPGAPDPLDRARAALVAAGLCPAEMDPAEFRRRFDVFRAHQEASGGLAVAWDGPALLVRAAAGGLDDGAAAAWRRHLPGCRIEVVDGDHYSILRPPHADRVAALVRDHFLAALRRGQGGDA